MIDFGVQLQFSWRSQTDAEVTAAFTLVEVCGEVGEREMTIRAMAR